MTLIYKIKKKRIPENLSQNTSYITDVHNFPTWSREDFYVSMVSSNYSQNYLVHNGLIQYNNLPHDVKYSSTIQIFKRKCILYSKANINI